MTESGKLQSPTTQQLTNREHNLHNRALMSRRIRPHVQGKFLFLGENKIFIKGVTYGTFQSTDDDSQFPQPSQVERDFTQMISAGINSVRTYTVPPAWFLNLALHHGLFIMVGIPWEQHITFLDDKDVVRSIEKRFSSAIKSCASHPSILCYSIGNEIPSSIVRWYGRRVIERFLKNLYSLVKEEDPESLVTYVNFPTTEYLSLPFLDFVCFNVYLESQEKLEAYLARLQILADDRPLVMAEIGLDSQSKGLQVQADTLQWQIRSIFRQGCTGVFVFAWTDEWYRGGCEIEDWDFGLTTRERKPKPALAVISKIFNCANILGEGPWPGFSVVVCTYDGASTIRETLESLENLDYPDYEIIVIIDGSTDDTLTIASQYDVAIINTTNCGLSSARNTGLQASSKEFVAYIDDDAYPDPDWLRYLAIAYQDSDYVGIGGPNYAPPGNDLIADCVANSPGGPIHVLLTDNKAEHIPGCNMSFSRSALNEVGGCDPRFRAAGDDVDLCWRIQAQAGEIGFHPAAMVWHHRRGSIRTFWNQQRGYGKAEALLEEKWPDKYNSMGHISWEGGLYGKGLTQHLGSFRERLYNGTWGSAPFQALYKPRCGTWLSLPLMPEWFLIIGVLLILSVMSYGWAELTIAVPLLIIAVILPIAQATLSACRGRYTSTPMTLRTHLYLVVVTTFLHLIQPVARLCGRIQHGLTPWRRKGVRTWNWARPLSYPIWTQTSELAENRLRTIYAALANTDLNVRNGNDFDGWDIEVRAGLFGGARLLMAIEEHGNGNEMVRFKSKPYLSDFSLVSSVLFGFVALSAGYAGSWVVSFICAVAFLSVGVNTIIDTGQSTGAIKKILTEYGDALKAAEAFSFDDSILLDIDPPSSRVADSESTREGELEPSL